MMHAKNILVFDDDESILHMLKAGLEQSGFAVETVSDEKSYREKLESAGPDLVILDVSLPGVDGLSLCKEIKNTPGLKSIPVIIITAYNDRKISEDAATYGALDCIVKPVSVEMIKKLIDAAR